MIRRTYSLEGPGLAPGLFRRRKAVSAAAFNFAGNAYLIVRMSNGGDNQDRIGGGGGTNTGIVVKTKPKTKKPSLYKVLLLNDDYTPMEFVVHILERFFSKSREEAVDIMLHVHRTGVGMCGVFTYEVAETKVTQVIDFARQHQHPLQCTMEKE